MIPQRTVERDKARRTFEVRKNRKPISMSKLFSILCVAVAATTGTVSAQAQKAQSTKEKVIFFEDFSAAGLDRSKWNVITGFHVNNEQQAYVDSTVVLYTSKSVDGAKNGALIIEPVYRPGYKTSKGTFDFISGRIDSKGKVEFTYGTASARIKMTEGSGLWPAFWALGNGQWPDCGEIDIMEYVGEADWTSVALHGPGYSGETPLVNKYFFRKGFDATQWHIYSVEWTSDGFNFYVDNDLIYRATRTMVEHYGRWAYDNPKYLILNFALGGAYPEKTNGVKQPYPGIPESTLKLIKDRKAKFIVDWVKVSQTE
jgi:beta-glucanase (GH16 family)